MSFLTADSGWALGYTNRLTLKRTTDGGRTWLTVSHPPARFAADLVPAPPKPVVSNVAFADDQHGYLWGDSLLATSNGGRTWSDVPPVRHIGQLVLVAGQVVALTAALTGHRVPLHVVAVGTSTWMTRTTPARGRVWLINSGSTLLLLQPGSAAGVGRLWTSVDLGGHWTGHPLPCAAGRSWAESVGVAFGRAAPWYIDCYNDDQSQQHKATTHRLWATSDQGRRWEMLGQPTHRGLPGLLAASGRHVLLASVGTPADVVSASSDGGRHWRDLFTDGGLFNGWQGPAFVTAGTAYLVGPTQYAATHLYRTDDAGAHWRTIRIS